MATIELRVIVEVSDETAEFIDRAFPTAGVNGAALEYLRSALKDSPFRTANVEVTSGPESDGDALPERPAIRLPNRTAPPVSKPHVPSPDGERRIGRPKTLDGYVASDGGAVREWGTRSPEELKRQGVRVYRAKGSGSQHAEPKVQPEPESVPEPEPTIRKPAKKGSAPVVLRRR